MKSFLYTIHLANRTQICVCETKNEGCPKGIAHDFHEALATGMLVVEDVDGTFDMIPVANIMHITCVPMEDDDEFDLESLFDEDDDEDDEFDDDELDEIDELDEDDE